jgi:protocatechuate 3,4-dioxygenase beta subunit
MKLKRYSLALILLVIGLLAAACGTVETVAPAPTQPVTTIPTQLPDVPSAAPTSGPSGAPAEVTVTPGNAGQPATEAVAAGPEPIEVTYFTPSQQEGPYYTVDKPADRDNDLVDFAGATAPPAGQVIEFGGRVYDANGLPVEGITIEIWQTDDSGVYLHPGDPSTGQRDPNFQFYGEALTAADGSYSFRTILPGLYEPRPRHIHVKLRLDGRELLTTQFYFAGEIDLRGDEAAMLIDLQPDTQGNDILVGVRDIILNADLTSE